MCQLLGISSNCEVDVIFSLKEWRRRGKKNLHGYGFAYWEGPELKILKEPLSLFEKSNDGLEEVRSFRSRLFVCHVRLASVGKKDGANTHPFQDELNGRQFAFAHNGDVRKIKKKRPLRRYNPSGKTDSEHAFLWLLENLGEVRGEKFTERLKELADEIRGMGRFNFLLCDGEKLWAYADDSLHFIERTPPYGGELVELKDAGYKMCLAEVKKPDEKAVLIATKPLSDERGWKKLGCGELVVVSRGEVKERPV